MPAPTNEIKARLLRGEILRGPFLSLGCPMVAEITGRAGFDFGLVDGEHGPFDPACMLAQMRALELAGTPAAVRVPAHDPWLVRQALDMGAQTIMVPMVNTEAQARALVDAAMYPPEGTRGLGGATMRAGGHGAFEQYAATANEQICLIAQIESAEAVENIPAIAAVDGIDALFIGPADLGCDTGFRDDLNAHALWRMVGEAVSLISTTGKVPGVYAGPDREAAMVDAGARMVAMGSDASILTEAMGYLAGAP
ncbi:MAG: aldolase/citrate lyase family protein [Pseudomonadota bacterium]